MNRINFITTRSPSSSGSYSLVASAAIVLAIGLMSFGCAGYRVGNYSLFRADVQTVHVPIFENDSFRRQLGQRLTEAVVREISSRSSYRIVPDTDADSTLQGRITSDRKHVLGENVNDEPRELQTDLNVFVTWNNRFGQPLMQRLELKIADNASFVPEGGQSMATAQQKVIDDVARQIVNQMEAGW